MKLYTEIIEHKEVQVLSVEDMKGYLNKLKGKLPKNVELAITYLMTYGIGSKDDVEDIINAPKTSFKKIANKFGLESYDIEDLQKMLKGLKDDIKFLPMYMGDAERRCVETGTKSLEDVALDLETEKGRDAVAKKYTKLVMAIAAKYRGKSGLDWNGLVSAGMMGLTKAMNDYHKPEDYIDADTSIDASNKEEAKKQKKLSFKQYAGWRIRQQILNDINDLSRTVRISQYQFDKNKAAGNSKGNFNTVSIDQKFGDGEHDDAFDIANKIPELSAQPDAFKGDYAEKWNEVYKIIDQKFSTRTACCFYKCYGVHGYKLMKQTEIAKELGITGAAVNMNIKQILNFIKQDKKCMSILHDIMDFHTESILVSNYKYGKEAILEAFINDDIYIMLEELTKWDNKTECNNAIGSTLECFDPENSEFIMECLCGDFEYLDVNYASNKRTIVRFLEHLYPTECIKKRSDLDILNRMAEVSEAFKKHNLSDF